MSNFDFIAFFHFLPSYFISYDLMNHSFTFTLPIKLHSCPACSYFTNQVHDYRIQPIKDASTLFSTANAAINILPAVKIF